MGIIVSGCPRNRARRLPISGGLRGPRLKGEAIPFAERVCVRQSSFVRRPPGGCFHVFPKGRMHLVGTCFIGYIKFRGSRDKGIAIVRYACSPTSGNKGDPSKEGMGKAVR